jgi:hypothetical protein
MAAALVVRLALLAAKPFWRDEAWVAWLVTLPREALGAFPYAIPAGFLALVRAGAAALPGLPPEVAYRLVPLAAGAAAVALMPELARRLGAPAEAALAALWLSAGLPAFIYYSRELKPYALDLLFAVLVPLLVAGRPRVEDQGRPRFEAALLFAVVVIAPWVSVGAVFSIGAGLAWVLVRSVRSGGWRAARAWILIALSLGVALAAAYVFVLRRQLASPLLVELWRGERLEGGILAFPRTLADFVLVLPRYLFPGVWPMAAALAALGAWRWRDARSLLTCLWLGAGALAAAAAACGLYVVGHGRFLLFAAPPLVLWLSAGLVEAGRAAVGPLGRWLGTAVAVLVSLAWSAHALALRARPPAEPPYFLYDVLQDIEPLIHQLDGAGVPPNRVMVSRYAADAFRFYSRGRLPGAYVCGIVECRDFGVALDRWLPGVSAEGWLILVAEEADPRRRRGLVERGFDVDEARVTRGARLWRITRRAAP